MFRSQTSGYTANHRDRINLLSLWVSEMDQIMQLLNPQRCFPQSFNHCQELHPYYHSFDVLLTIIGLYIFPFIFFIQRFIILTSCWFVRCDTLIQITLEWMYAWRVPSISQRLLFFHFNHADPTEHFRSKLTVNVVGIFWWRNVFQWCLSISDCQYNMFKFFFQFTDKNIFISVFRN